MPSTLRAGVGRVYRESGLLQAQALVLGQVEGEVGQQVTLLSPSHGIHFEAAPGVRVEAAK